MQNLQKLYNSLDVINYLGHIYNNPKLLLDKKNKLETDDLLDRLHKIVYVAAENIAAKQDITEIDDISVSMFLENYPDQQEYFNRNNGSKFIQDIKELSQSASFKQSLENIKKFSLLRKYEKVGFDTSFIYKCDLVDPEEISLRSKKFNELNISSIKNMVKVRLNSVEFKEYEVDEEKAFQAGEGIYDVIKSCKEKPQFGHPFQSKLYNTVFRGMLGKKVMIRSGNTGSGKTRTMLGDMCEVSAVKMFDIERGIWIDNPRPVSSIFISTELDKQELQLILLAIISGIEENRIKDGRFDEELENRLIYAGKVLEDSNIYIECIENFTMSEIESIIERNILNNDCAFVFFDYIQITPSLAQEYHHAFGYSLREDQMLNLIVTKFKNMANNYNLFILTATQLNRNYKVDGYLDATHLRGGTATPDKADFGVITVEASKADIEKLDPIISAKLQTEEPTHAHHVYKNRGGQYKKIIIWTKTNLGNMRVKDCFVTNQDYEEIFLEPTIL